MPCLAADEYRALANECFCLDVCVSTNISLGSHEGVRLEVTVMVDHRVRP